MSIQSNNQIQFINRTESQKAPVFGNPRAELHQNSQKSKNVLYNEDSY